MNQLEVSVLQGVSLPWFHGAQGSIVHGSKESEGNIRMTYTYSIIEAKSLHYSKCL